MKVRIQNFFSQFGYLSKLRFILSLAILPALALFVILPWLFNPPIDNLKCKINALEKLHAAIAADLQNPTSADKMEEQFQTLRRQLPLSCAFTLEMRDNGTRRLLQALNWELPESRTMLTNLINSQQSDLNASSTSIETWKKRLYDHVNRTVEQLELAYRANDALHPFLSEVQNWKTQMISLEPSVESLQTTLELQKILYSQAIDLLKQQLHALQSMRFIGLLLLSIGSLIAALFYINKGIRRPLKPLMPHLQQLENGIYSASIPPSKESELQEIISAFNQLAKFLEGYRNQIHHMLAALKNTFGTVLETAKNLEGSIDAQAMTARQISTASQRFLSSVQNLEDGLIAASRSAMSAGLFAATGSKGLDQMDTIMQGMLTASSTIVTTLSTLQEEVGTINKVIDTIVKIADQSNLLSLNTAIRANKTGIQGKGFTVIADRIREMADQIARATLAIETSVQEIVKAVVEANQGINHFSDQIRSHVQETSEISTQLKQLIGETQNQIERFDQIKEAMQQQMQRITSITAITGEIKKDTASSHILVSKLHREMINLAPTLDRDILAG